MFGCLLEFLCLGKLKKHPISNVIIDIFSLINEKFAQNKAFKASSVYPPVVLIGAVLIKRILHSKMQTKPILPPGVWKCWKQAKKRAFYERENAWVSKIKADIFIPSKEIH